MTAAPTALILKSLDCLSARQAAVAQNVANAQTAGYRPVRVTFEKALAAAADRGSDAIGAVTPKLETTPLRDGPGVRIDQELATASSTALRYSALIELLNSRGHIDDVAVQGNL